MPSPKAVLTKNVLTLLTLLPVLASPAAAGMRDTEACKREVATTYASLDASANEVQSTMKGKREDSCLAYRRHFVDIVKARAAAVQCKTGDERVNDIGRLDGAVEQVNAGIAERCG